MAQTVPSQTVPPPAIALSRTTTSLTARLLIFAAVSIVTGILWDISWHRTIGRDSFWTPAHMAIYVGGALGGLLCGAVVLKITLLGSAEEKRASVRLWGMHGPLGAWVAIWGAFAMLTSAPFDDWWHAAYGLDVKILSPPHTVLAFGMWAVVWGALLLVLREQNTVGVTGAAQGRWLFIFAAGILTAMAAVFFTERSFPNHQHSASFYLLSCASYPVYLTAMARASKLRWGATLTALIYMLIMGAAVWILPLFEGHPRLGPIYNPVTRFVPLPFPLLLIVPALAIDLIRHAIGLGRGWKRELMNVLCAGIAFTVLFVLTQWYFSQFMLSAYAENWFFAADRHWGYTDGGRRGFKQFWDEVAPGANPPFTTTTFFQSAGLAILAAGIGNLFGSWMSRVRR